jgi:ATP-dependent DNA helicase PIF1
MDDTQKKTLEMALKGHNILLTGFPGTGKSYTICEIARKLKRMGKNVRLTASTGIAAQNMRKKLPNFQLTTIHKFMALKDGRYENDELVDLIMSDENYADTKENILAVNTIIIDEISMLSVKMFEQIQYILKSVRQSSYPFGGIQIILSGDFYQLPNINYGDDGTLCYHSDLVKNCFHHVNLETVHRQEEPDFISALHQIAG